jgi:uncharacterized protein (DUF488 family)
MKPGLKMVWTIGHSTRTIGDFIELLKFFEITALADIRTFPGSRRYPHFNKDQLSSVLEKEGILYVHMPDLGGRRKPEPESVNTAWRHPSFRGYADYMQTPLFKKSVEQLEKLAENNQLVYMCSEAMWWKCHRALVSDYLKTAGWAVMHIMSLAKAQEHPYTAPAKPVQGKLFY